jgi:hypothetical protein
MQWKHSKRRSTARLSKEIRKKEQKAKEEAVKQQAQEEREKQKILDRDAVESIVEAKIS